VYRGVTPLNLSQTLRAISPLTNSRIENKEIVVGKMKNKNLSFI